MLQANFDESERDDVLVIAGWVASTDQWIKFSIEWEEALRTYTNGEPFKMSYANANWSEALQKERIGHLSHIIKENVEFGISVAVHKPMLAHYMNGFEPVLSDPYYYCFWQTMVMLLQDDKLIGDEKIELIFDAGRREKEIEAGMDAFMEAAPEFAKERMRKKPRFEDDKTWMPLQAADLRALWARRRIEEREYGLEKKEGPSAFRTKSRGYNLVIGEEFLRQHREVILQASGALPTITEDEDGGIIINFGGFSLRTVGQ